ncbi:MAG: PAS domain S-box protein [Chloroflexi bacterium]|nr:PAS domain S-box protein [Chloroflexota bacterium]
MNSVLRVLIVDDSEEDAILLLSDLRKAGYSPVHKRVDTAEGLELALQDQEWDVVLCDYVMPSFSGPAALKLLQQKGLDIPLIIISGQIGEDIAVEAMKAGARDYLSKGNLKRLGPSLKREIAETRIRQERRKAAEALRESEDRFRIMADCSPLMIWVTGPDGGIQFINKAYRDFFGVTLEEVSGSSWQPLVHHDDSEAYLNELHASLRERRPFRAEARVRRADGEWRWVESFAVPRFSDRGSSLVWSAVARILPSARGKRRRSFSIRPHSWKILARP